MKEQGLEDQLLGLVVSKEKEELQTTKEQLILDVANDKNKLVELEDNILGLLSSSKGSLLDDTELIETLQSSKITSEEVKARLVRAEQVEKVTDAAREGYETLFGPPARPFWSTQEYPIRASTPS